MTLRSENPSRDSAKKNRPGAHCAEAVFTVAPEKISECALKESNLQPSD
jgi:hypothetical protein